jgi:L-asparaginase II
LFMAKMKRSGVPLVEVWRGDILESTHSGHVVICDSAGETVDSWGDPSITMLPRSSCKMIQALPLIETGAADAVGLGPEHLALACASHNGAAIHTDRVAQWLAHIGSGEHELCCGPQEPSDKPARDALIRAGRDADQRHNNCSGKHAGFLTVTRHLRADPDYNDANHPLQRAVLEAFEDVTGEPSPGHVTDGCSAPNFACSLKGLAQAMASFASPRAGARGRAQERLVDAMMAHPDLVAGQGRACTDLMRAAIEPLAVKTGAEGVFAAILPERKIGIALKIDDGATRAANSTIAALLVGLGVLDARNPTVIRHLRSPILTRLGARAGEVRPILA